RGPGGGGLRPSGPGGREADPRPDPAAGCRLIHLRADSLHAPAARRAGEPRYPRGAHPLRGVRAGPVCRVGRSAHRHLTLQGGRRLSGRRWDGVAPGPRPLATLRVDHPARKNRRLAGFFFSEGPEPDAKAPGRRNHTFFTNSDFSFMAPMPSILQSISWSPSHRRMFFTLVPTFTTADEPLTFRSLMTVTVSPSCRTLPTESLMTRSSEAGAASPGTHSWAHSGQTSRAPSS